MSTIKIFAGTFIALMLLIGTAAAVESRADAVRTVTDTGTETTEEAEETAKNQESWKEKLAERDHD